ncbi:hypothetical protein [Bacillus sp. AFS055030]|uniref:hypothetical protein n=1 Tax=Bacillus sp. AFS055030 TaxID=2033507 RepID=UPI000BFE0AE4|nr:hypothetical protein [Bacillus sp. AFS055030]PGL72614.1 hypothetical protein CN925_04470 [Bacillus sp. AFS055030]
MSGTNIKDIIRFKSELYFNGAVQIDWFYQLEKQGEVSKSFVFHGPQYFGVGEEDVSYKSHRLVDTASFANVIADKLSNNNQGSNFIMTIAPYGTGKSHLAVTLATLFSSKSKNKDAILRNLKIVDSSIGQEITEKVSKPNVVLVLNGMKDFNLNYEILNATQKFLDMYEVDASFLKSLTKQYEIARSFVTNTFSSFKEVYIRVAGKELGKVPQDLQQYLIQNILYEPKVFEVINNVYEHVNGTHIRWDEGVSAGDVLLKISQTLCGERGAFGKVLVLFDEFGRYIEYASTYPTRAGDSALQQIYEAVQDSEDTIVFVGFIQSDLKSYLTRVERTSNISRYVGRYEASEKIHLSSNLETIFANLIERIDKTTFESLVVNKINKEVEDTKWNELHEKMLAWLPAATSSSVWNNYDRFKKVVLEGIFPLHPLTTWMLSNLSAWLQQRSSLTFLKEQIDKFSEEKIHEFGDLPTIPSISIIQSSFFKELLSAEEDGRQQSEYCSLYNQILIKYGDKLNQKLQDVLAANLILRIGRFKTISREDVIYALSIASNLTEKDIKESIHSLENDFGVLSFDDVANVYDFVADATGVNDFKRLITRKKAKIGLQLDHLLEGIVTKLLDFTDIEPAFSKHRMIATNEWMFTQSVAHLNDINNQYILNMKKEWDLATGPKDVKGKIVWIYLPENTSQESIDNLIQLYRKHQLHNSPILLFLLDDKEKLLNDAIYDYQVSQTFNEDEKIKYARFIPEFNQKVETLVIDRFNSLAKDRLKISEDGTVNIQKRLLNFTNEVFESLYDKVVSFPFTGFKKTQGKAKQNLSKIARIVLGGCNYQVIQAETTEVKNRIEEVLYEGKLGSWGVVNTNYQLISPRNPKLQVIFNEIDNQLQNGQLKIEKLFLTYQKPPYGINDYSLSLILAVYFVQRKLETRVQLKGTRLRLEEWANQIFKDKEVNIKDLLETEIVVVNPDQSVGRYLKLIGAVERNTDVNECVSLNKEFEQLKLEEDIPEEVEDKVTYMQFLLEEGMKYYYKTLKQIGSLKEDMSTVKKEIDMKKVFDVINRSQLISGYIEDSTKYVYNQEQVEIAKGLVKNGHEFVQKEFSSWLIKLKCQNLGQLSRFESWVKIIITELNKHNYLKEARALKDKLNKITDDLKVIQQLENMNDVVKEYVRSNNPSAKSGFEELKEMEKKGKELIDFILNHKVERSYLESYLESLQTHVDKIKAMLSHLETELMNFYDAVFDLKDIKDCESILKSAKWLLTKDLKVEDVEAIESTANELQNFMNEIEKLKAYNNSRTLLGQEIEGLEKNWIDIESDIDFSIIINNFKEEQEKQLNELTKKWSDRYLTSISEVLSWDANKCIRRLKEIEYFPEYLDNFTIIQAEKLQQDIQVRLNDIKVDAVYEMFNALDEEQQKICMEKISQLMKV